MIIYAGARGIIPDTDVTKQLEILFSELGKIVEEKTLVFESGTYLLSSQLAWRPLLYITNSMGDKEWREGEEPHRIAAALYLKGISGLTIEGSGALFLLDGQAVNLVLEDCSDITIREITLDTIKPDMHELKVIGRGAFYIDYELDKDSDYIEQRGEFFFKGTDYVTPLLDCRVTAYWIGRMPANNTDSVSRTSHPLRSALKIRERVRGVFRAYYALPPRYEVGARFYLFDVRRKWAGIFINRSERVKLEAISQRFNYGLALVAQDSDTLTLDSLTFEPAQDGARLMASVADFMQICSCRGKITVRNSYFSGAGDDCLNVHGIHFLVTEVKNREIIVRFMHSQTHGFNPLRVGDRITYVNPNTMLSLGEALIEDSRLIDEYNIVLRLDNIEGAKVGFAIEDIDACPEVKFVGNTLTRIITRGLLLTTRGKITVRGNRFVNTTMSAVLVSDDAAGWYESGAVKDLTVEDNEFLYSGGYTVIVKPENREHKSYVHSGIIIRANSIERPRFYFKSVDKVIIEKNIYQAKPKLKLIASKVDMRDS